MTPISRRQALLAAAPAPAPADWLAAFAEREAAKAMINDARQALGDDEREITLGADKGYAGDVKNASSLAELQRCMGIVNRKVAIAQELLSKGGGKKPPASSSKRPPIPVSKTAARSTGFGLK